jgi:hypothetical protein
MSTISIAKLEEKGGIFGSRIKKPGEQRTAITKQPEDSVRRFAHGLTNGSKQKLV